MSSSSIITIRVRSNVGLWRVQVLNNNTLTPDDVLNEIKVIRPHIVLEKYLSRDPACTDVLDPKQPLIKQLSSLQNGTMIHCRVDPSTATSIIAKPSNEDDEEKSKETAATTPTEGVSTNMRRIIDKDGAIRLVPTSEAPEPGKDKGFRKGMLALRDMKMHWTLSDFVAMDSQYEFKIKRQEKAFCKQVSLDVPSIANFQSYVQRFAFQRKRFGFLYGKYITIEDAENDYDDGDDDDKLPPTKVLVEAIYEPPQQVDNEAVEGYVALDDDQEETVDQIAEMLGLRKVGWIFVHEAREKGFTMSASEVIMAAEYQLEAADGVKKTPFVTVTVSPKSDGTVSVEAFQVSKQCMAMVAEEALEVDATNPKVCNVNETFTAIQEGKESKTVENNFFLTVVPIVQHTSDIFVAEFPRCNRDLDDRIQSHDEMKKHLSKSGTAGWTFEDRLADFNLLIYLSKFLDMNTDFPKICTSIIDRNIPLDDGYKLIIKSMAGMEGSY